MKPKKPTHGKPKLPPRTRVNRKRLMALITRYRKLLLLDLKYLKGLDGDTVGLRVRKGAEAAGGTAGGMQVLYLRQEDPGELESNCVSYAGPTGSETEMIDTLTPYTRALTEFVKEEK